MCWSWVSWETLQPILKDFFVPLAGAAAGAWATLRVFTMQSTAQAAELARTVKEDNEKQDKQADRNLSHFVWLLEDLVEVAKKQNEDYLTVASNLASSPLKQHDFITRASGTINRILSLKQDDIYFSFIRKALDTDQNRKHIASIYKDVDLINQLIESVKYKYKGHLKDYDEIGSEYREIIEEVRDLVIERTSKARATFSIYIDPFALYLAKASREFLDALTTLPDASSLEWQHNNFLWPIQKTLVEEFENDSRTAAIVNRGRRGLILIGRMKHSAKVTASFLEHDSTTLSKAISDLQVEIDYIKSLIATTKPNINTLIK